MGAPDRFAAPITEWVIDSREAVPGALFVALKGEHTDGHLFVADAFRRGAQAALVEREIDLPAELGAQVIDMRAPVPAAAPGPLCLRVENALQALQGVAHYWRERHANLRVAGVTGSVGKTTTKELVAAVLSRRFRVLKNEGNLNNEIGLPLTLLRLDAAHACAVLEMGMYDVGDIALLAGIAHPHVGVVINVQPVHLERARTIERIAQAKAELPAALPAAPEGCAVLNYDDPRVRAMAARTRARVITFGREPGADLRAEDVTTQGLAGVRFTLRHAAGRHAVRLPLPGAHHVYTALAAAGAALAMGLSWDEIVAALAAPEGVAARLRAVPGLEGATLLDDTYNASPSSTVAALRVLADLPGRRVAVLGDMLELGEYEEEGHRLVGREAARVVQLLVAVGARARHIADEALAGGMPAEAVLTAPDPGAAVPLVRARLAPGDVILIKGSRSIRMETIVAALRTEEN